jgi:hypothetical protein
MFTLIILFLSFPAMLLQTLPHSPLRATHIPVFFLRLGSSTRHFSTSFSQPSFFLSLFGEREILLGSVEVHHSPYKFIFQSEMLLQDTSDTLHFDMI